MTDHIHARLRRARARIGIVGKDREVLAGPKRWWQTTHAGLLAVVDPALDAEGLCHAQSIAVAGEVIVCETWVYADDGQVLGPMRYPVGVPGKADMTAWGAQASYARRCGLMAALGLRDGSSEEQERHQMSARLTDESAASPEQEPGPPEPADLITARSAALEVLAGRLRLERAEVGRRLGVIAATDIDVEVCTDDEAPTREHLAEAMGRDMRGWRQLGDADFSALLRALERWPEDL